MINQEVTIPKWLISRIWAMVVQLITMQTMLVALLEQV